MDEDKKKQNEYIQNLVKDTLKNVEPDKITEDTKSKIKCRWENPFAPETIDQYNYTNKSWGFSGIN